MMLRTVIVTLITHTYSESGTTIFHSGAHKSCIQKWNDRLEVCNRSRP